MANQETRMTYSYEDFSVGDAVQLSAHTFSREEIVGFAGRYDPQPFHLSEAAGEASHFGGLVASGWNTCSAMMGILVRDMLADSTSMGSPGLDNIRWIKPVYVGDSVRLTVRVLDKRVSKSKPDRGIVATRWEAHNQNGDLVLTVDSSALFGLRNPGV
jgi:acyl dehydratase